MKPVLLLMVMIAVSPALAESMEDFVYRCQRDGEERVLEVRYPTGSVLPCEVHYTKYGNSQRLWSAQNTRGFCQFRAFEFVQKQIGWGWQCFRENPGEEPLEVAATTVEE